MKAPGKGYRCWFSLLGALAVTAFFSVATHRQSPSGGILARAFGQEREVAENSEVLREACVRDAGDLLFVDFGASGLWYLDGTGWQWMTLQDPTSLVRAGPGFVAGFGSLGLWGYDGENWVQMNGPDPGNGTKTMAAAVGGLVADYGAYGLW